MALRRWKPAAVGIKMAALERHAHGLDRDRRGAERVFVRGELDDRGGLESQLAGDVIDRLARLVGHEVEQLAIGDVLNGEHPANLSEARGLVEDGGRFALAGAVRFFLGGKFGDRREVERRQLLDLVHRQRNGGGCCRRRRGERGGDERGIQWFRCVVRSASNSADFGGGSDFALEEKVSGVSSDCDGGSSSIFSAARMGRIAPALGVVEASATAVTHRVGRLRIGRCRDRLVGRGAKPGTERFQKRNIFLE